MYIHIINKLHPDTKQKIVLIIQFFSPDNVWESNLRSALLSSGSLQTYPQDILMYYLLQVIVNELHSQIESLNDTLVKLLMARDELHMGQDSMLVDIEDLTRYL